MPITAMNSAEKKRNERFILSRILPGGSPALHRMRLLLLLSLLPSFAFAQSMPVEPDRFIADRSGRIGPSPVFTIDKADTSLFGAGKQPQLILPSSKGEHGFVFVPCLFCPAEYLKNEQTLVYFTEIGQPGMRAYVDRNFNYDFTDDGEAVGADSNGYLFIEVTSPDRSKSIPLRYNLLSKSIDVSKIPVELFAANPFYAGTKLIDKSFWFAVEYLSIKGKDIIIGTDSICITFFDSNLDGCFTSTEDMFAFFPYGIDSAYTSKYRGVRAIAPGLIVGFNGHAYEIKCDTGGCSAVTIVRRPDLAAPHFLSVGDPLPHFSVQFFEGDSADIYTVMQPGKYTYIEFWGIWCGSCRIIIPDLKNMNDTMSDRVTIVSLDAYDDRQRVKGFVKENQMTWTQGYSNEQIENLLYGGYYPYGILVDPAGKIVGFDMDPRSVTEIISQKK
jgi:thiol-disulfide isomerase/thioredoxin